jgi:hypothetical protein
VLANDHQYLVTLGLIKRFERALAAPNREGLQSRAADATRAGLRSQLDDLGAEIAEYRARRKGNVKTTAPTAPVVGGGAHEHFKP